MKKSIAIIICIICTLAFCADLKQADTLFKAEKWQEARKEYQSVLQELKGKEMAEVLYKIGYTFEREGGKFDEAIDAYRKATLVEEADDVLKARSYLRMGYILKLQRKFQQAIEEFTRIEQLRNFPPEILGEALLYKAWSYNNLNQDALAFETFKKIVENENIPAINRATALLNIAGKLQKQKNYKEAIKEYQKVIDLKGATKEQKDEANNYLIECKNLLEGPKPFYIRPYVTRVSPDSAEIYWISQLTDEKAKFILKSQDQTIELNPEVSPIRTTECFLFCVKVTNLKPGVLYRYEVICEKEKTEGSFKTPSETNKNVIFCVITDTQLNMDVHMKMAELISKENPDFILHTGDLTDKGSSWSRWKAELFDPGYQYFKMAAFYPAIGNHDGGPFFPLLFGMKQGKNYYDVTYGNTQIIVIDSYWAGGPGSKSRQQQLNWLEQVLSQSKATWKIVGLHVPMVSAKTGDRPFGQQDFLPVLEKYGADIVLAGHVACYLRTVPLGNEGVKPIIHIINSGPGPAGQPIPSPFNAAGSSRKQFLVFRIDDKNLEMLCKDADGNILDRMVLKKQNGSYQKEVMDKAVDFELFKKVSNIYYELLGLGNYNLVVTTVSIPQPGKKLILSLDLNKLPRGSLKKELLPEGIKLVVGQVKGSPWKLEKQEIPLTGDKVQFEVIVPENFTMDQGIFKPDFEISINISLDGRLFEPFTTKVVFNPEIYQKISQSLDSNQQVSSKFFILQHPS